METEGVPHGVGTNLGLMTDIPPAYENISDGVSIRIVHTHYSMCLLMNVTLFRQPFCHSNMTEEL